MKTSKLFLILSGTFVLITGCVGDDDDPINASITGGITISGTARVDETLEIESAYRDRNGLDNNTPIYQWYGDSTAIAGATESTFTLTNAQLNQSIYVVMDFVDDQGFAETLTSDSVTVNYPFTVSMVVDREATIGIKQSQDFGSTWGASIVPTVNDAAEFHYYPSIASDGQGNLVAVTVSEYNPNYGGEYDVVVTASTDNGATWSDIKLLVPTDTADSQSDEEPRVATDNAGTWAVVWGSGEDMAGTGTDDDIFMSQSTDNGATWSTPVAVNPWAASDSLRDASPQISMNGANWTVSWSSAHDPSDDMQTDFEIYSIYSSDAGVTWSDPVKVSIGGLDNTSNDSSPIMHINENGRGLLIWNGREDGDNVDELDVYYSISPNFGESWSAGLLLNVEGLSDAAGDHDYASSVLVESDGTLIASWYGQSADTGSDDEIFYRTSTNNGVTWGDAQILNPNSTSDSGDEFGSRFIANPKGGWIASWVNDFGNVYVTQSQDLMTWSASPVLIDEDSDETISWVLH